jgi:hypothetical protein
MKTHAGSGKPQGSLNRGTQQQPSPTHGGSGAPKGRVHTSQPLPVRGTTHGGTNLARTLKRTWKCESDWRVMPLI